MTRRRPAQLGFTLVEVLVAIIIMAAIAAAATVAISQSLRAQSVSNSRRESRARAEAAAERIAIDIENVVRDADLYDARVLITDGGDGLNARDQLLLFASSATVARAGNVQPEGGRYEIQYRAVDRTQPTAAPARRTRNPAPPGAVLWRRVDPVPDEVPDGGGVVFPVAEGLLSLSIQGFDGESWFDSWDSDRDGLPHAVRVDIRAGSSTDSRRVATSRRVIAIDRVPPPLIPAEEETSASSGGGG